MVAIENKMLPPLLELCSWSNQKLISLSDSWLTFQILMAGINFNMLAFFLTDMYINRYMHSWIKLYNKNDLAKQ